MIARVSSALLKVGDTFTVGGSTRVGRFEVISEAEALRFATQVEIDGYSKPIRLLTVVGSDPTSVGDTVVWDSLSLVVKKSVPVRFRGETVAKRLMVA